MRKKIYFHFFSTFFDFLLFNFFKMIPNFFELNQFFTNEKACIEFLIDKGLLVSQPRCFRCRKPTYRFVSLWKCKNRNCSWAKSIYNGSVFGNTRLSPTKVFFIGYLWLIGCPNSSIQVMTGCSSGTITSFAKLFREMVTNEIEETQTQIGGEGIIVEIDESKFGKRKYNRGHSVEGAWVIGGVERTPERRIFAEVVEKRDAETLLEVIKRRVAPGSTIHTDMWKAYNNIPEIISQSTHLTVNHSKNFKDPGTGVHTNTIEGTWNGIKINIPGRARHKKLIGGYIAEFIWRRQNKDDLWAAFLTCLSHSLVF